MGQETGVLRWAIRYQRLGLSVIPVQPRGKEPLLPWKEFQSRIASETELRVWWKQWPDANVGVVTGYVSRIIIVDLDGPKGIAEASQLNLRNPIIALTGRGKHLWYKHPGGIVQNDVRRYPGIDIRGDGGFVLAPPSIHPNGKRYRWLRPLNLNLLPEFPVALFQQNVLTPDVKRVANESGWIAKALEEMKNGNIDDTLFRICSRLRNDGYSQSDCRVLLAPHAARVGADAGHLEDKINNVWGRYAPAIHPTRMGFEGSTGPSTSQLILHTPTNPDSLNEYAKRTDLLQTDSGFSTGYPKFDTLSKGLKKGEVLTVAARTGVGKTNFVITPIRTFCTAGKKVLLFSTEMSFDQIWQRYRATLGNVETFRDHAFFICDEFTPDIARIEEAIRHVMPDLFIFDHISHVSTDYHLLSKFMSEIKRLARMFNIPAIVTAQLNRNADWVESGERVEPRLSMIQGSDQIGQMSAQVLLLNEKRINADYTEIEGLIVKNRHGDKGMIQFGLFKHPYRMEEL